MFLCVRPSIYRTLFRELKSRAALEGLKLKELVARYLEAGLAQSAPPTATPPQAKHVADGKPFVSAYDVMKDGVGVADSGVSDLATNPEYMEGFGRR